MTRTFTTSKIVVLMSIVALLLVAAACGNAQSKPAAASAGHQDLYLTIIPGGRLGPDGKMHDTYSPADIKLVKGRTYTIHIENFDGMPHSFTATKLGLDVTAKAAKKDGDPVTTTFTFTPKATGTFTWLCDLPCDKEAGGWAMSHNGYMKGTITIVNPSGA